MQRVERSDGSDVTFSSGGAFSIVVAFDCFGLPKESVIDTSAASTSKTSESGVERVGDGVLEVLYVP